MLEKMQQSKAEKSSQVCLAKYLLNIHIVLMQLYKESTVAGKTNGFSNIKMFIK